MEKGASLHILFIYIITKIYISNPYYNKFALAGDQALSHRQSAVSF